jgi:hypothetical protein
MDQIPYDMRNRYVRRRCAQDGGTASSPKYYEEALVLTLKARITLTILVPAGYQAYLPTVSPFLIPQGFYLVLDVPGGCCGRGVPILTSYVCHSFLSPLEPRVDWTSRLGIGDLDLESGSSPRKLSASPAQTHLPLTGPSSPGSDLIHSFSIRDSKGARAFFLLLFSPLPAYPARAPGQTKACLSGFPGWDASLADSCPEC